MSPDQDDILKILEVVTSDMTPTMISSLIGEYGKDSFLVLIACLLSLRAKDTVTYPVCRELFARAQTPKQMLKIPIFELEALFYSIGFYRKKALMVHQVSEELLTRFDGLVPDDEEKLLSIKGVGRKTAALVLAEGFGIPAICVDTHVHRLANRLGFVDTNTPYQTEIALKKLFPRHYWSKINPLLVVWGQNICTPTAPFCLSKCVIKNLCPKNGVKRMR